MVRIAWDKVYITEGIYYSKDSLGQGLYHRGLYTIVRIAWDKVYHRGHVL